MELRLKVLEKTVVQAFAQRSTSANTGYLMCLRNLLLVWLLLAVGGAWAAMPLAGVFIENRVSVTYLDVASGLTSTLDSNTVRVKVAPLEAVTVITPININSGPNNGVNLAHRITNTGNTPSSYALNFSNQLGDDYDLLNLKLYQDIVANGVADAGEPSILNGGTVYLNPGESVDVVLTGTVGATVLFGKVSRVILTATSTTSPTATANNVDSVTVSNAASLTLSKSASTSNASPGNDITYALTGSNSGISAASGIAVSVNNAATNLVVLRDTIPANTTFAGIVNSGVSTVLYHSVGDPLHSYSTSAPANLSVVDAIGFGYGNVPASGSLLSNNYGGTFKVKVNRNASGNINNAATVYYNDSVNAAPASTPSNNVVVSVAFNAPVITYFRDATYIQPVNSTSLGSPLFVQADAAQCNFVPDTVETRLLIITSKLTGDSESYAITETGANTGIFRIDNIVTRDAINGVIPGNGILDIKRNDVLTASLPGCGGGVSVETIIFIDPAGIVFDSKTGLPIAGATVKLIDVTGAGNGGVPGGLATVLGSDGTTPSPNVIVTLADGTFAFPTVSASLYKLVVTPPIGYQGPSAVPQALLPPNAATGFSYVINLPGSYGGDFAVNLATGAVKLDVPLDRFSGLTGVAFDSLTDTPLANATVTLVDQAGAPAKVFLGDGITPASNVTTTDANGKYQFAVVLPGTYQIKVVRNSYVYPSVVPAGQLPPGHSINNTGSYGASFTIAQTQGAVIVDLPLDSKSLVGLFVEKSAGRDAIEQGDFLDYTVKVKNTGTGALANVVLNDILPAGFGYHLGTARLEGKPMADPSGEKGQGISFAVGTILAGKTVTVTYRVHVGAGAQQGDGINRATARSGGVGSNQATARVIVRGGVFSDRAFVLGKVFVDCNRNRVQDAGEVGIPGVRLYMEDGTFVIADSEGKYSFYGVSPHTHVLKLDTTTLPSGAELINLSNRNAGDAGSRFVDVKKGELHKANFAEGSCTPAILDQVKARRAKAETIASEGERAVKAQITADGVPLVVADPRSLPSSGVVGETNRKTTVPSYTPLITGGPSQALLPTAPKAPAATSIGLNLEKEIKELDNTLAFIGLKDNDTLPYTQARVYVKGVMEIPFILKVNGKEIPASRVGTRSAVADKKMEAWEYIGVNLKPGSNTLEVTQRDAAGENKSVTINVIAPDQLGKLEIIVPTEGSPADGITPVKIKVKLTDVAGVPVTMRTPFTLETSLGRFDVEDLNKTEPGDQVFIEGGSAEFLLLPPVEPGQASIRISSGIIKADSRVDFLPDLRPLIGAGIIEGVINLRNLNTNGLVPTRQQDGFESELKHFSRDWNGGKSSAAARTAFFLKGKVKGEYLLTAAYDSDKDTKERLFRDIQPDEFYPVYGDSAVKGFDAQSTGRFYVRVDKNKSYLLYGDYTTQTNSNARQLSNYSRSLTGIKEHYETDRVVINAFASRDSTRQVVDEFRANGTSGPFSLSKASSLTNSEKVEIITRDRNQPALVIKTEAQSRFSDYEIDSFSGRILFRGPIASLDANLNPVFVRITYEIDQGGDKFWVYGADAQVKITDKLEVGGVYTEDRNPQDSTSLTGTKKLAGVNATYKLGDNTYLSGEVARTENFKGEKGNGERVELRHQGDKLEARVYWGKTDSTFDNPSSTLNEGRSEAGAKAVFRIDDRTRILGEAIRTEDVKNNGKREAELVSVERSFDNNMRVELGARHSKETATPAQASTIGTTPNEFTSLRAKVTTPVPYVPLASVYGEYEQDIKNSDRKTVALGGEYQLGNHARIYGRHELISSLSGQFTLNTTQRQNATVFGIDTDYMTDGHLFSEYRLRDALTGREAEAALGLRNRWHLSEGLALDTGFERVHQLSGDNGGTSSSRSESTSATLGLEYTGSKYWLGSGRVEIHRGTSNETLLNTLGIASKLTTDWTFLAKNIISINRNTGGGLSGRKLDERLQLGFAYRQTESDVWSGLARFEHRYERDDTQLNHEIKRNTEIFSTHINYQPSKDFIWTGRYGAKWTNDQTIGLNTQFNTQLLSTRFTYDLSQHWDIGIYGATLFSRGFKARELGFGVEAGYLLTSNLWLSVGYNIMGFREDDLTGGDYTNRGAFLRLRYKFDEDLFAAKHGKTSAGSAR